MSNPGISSLRSDGDDLWRSEDSGARWPGADGQTSGPADTAGGAWPGAGPAATARPADCEDQHWPDTGTAGGHGPAEGAGASTAAVTSGPDSCHQAAAATGAPEPGWHTESGHQPAWHQAWAARLTDHSPPVHTASTAGWAGHPYWSAWPPPGEDRDWAVPDTEGGATWTGGQHHHSHSCLSTTEPDRAALP